MTKQPKKTTPRSTELSMTRLTAVRGGYYYWTEIDSVAPVKPSPKPAFATFPSD